MTADDPTRHHYVPVFLLGNFAYRLGKRGKGSNQLWVHDKHTKRKYVSTARDAANQRRFNEFELRDGQLVSAERGLAKVELQAAPTIARMLEARSANTITASERLQLSYFIALQMLRVPGHLSDQESLREQMLAVAVKAGTAKDVAKHRGRSEDARNPASSSRLNTLQPTLDSFARSAGSLLRHLRRASS